MLYIFLCVLVSIHSNNNNTGSCCTVLQLLDYLFSSLFGYDLGCVMCVYMRFFHVTHWWCRKCQFYSLLLSYIPILLFPKRFLFLYLNTFLFFKYVVDWSYWWTCCQLSVYKRKTTSSLQCTFVSLLLI